MLDIYFIYFDKLQHKLFYYCLSTRKNVAVIFSKTFQSYSFVDQPLTEPLIHRYIHSRAAAIHRCTGEPRYFLSRYIRISIFEWDIAVSQNNKVFLIKNQKLLYQHSEITVLFSSMTPYLSTSLSFSHKASSLLIS